MATKTVTLFPSSVNEELTAVYPVIEDPSYPLTNAVGKDPTNSVYAQWSIPETSNAYSRVMYDFDTSSVPLNAVIDSIQFTIKAMISNTTSQVISKSKIELRRLFNGAYNIFGSANVPGSPTEIAIPCDTLTREELNVLFLDLTTIRGKKTSTVYQRFYGASLTINYTVPDSASDTLHIKQSGEWVPVTDVYRKVDGTWMKTEDVSTVFRSNCVLRHMKQIDNIPIGVNLFDKTKDGYVTGGLLNDQGAFSGWGPGAISNYIKVKSEYTFSINGAANSWQKLFYYDDVYNFIGCTHSLAYMEEAFEIGQGTKYVIPDNAVFVRVNIMQDVDVQIKRII